MTYRAELDLELCQALDRVAEVSRFPEGEGGFIAWAAGVAYAQQQVMAIVQRRVEVAEGARPKWWKFWQ